MATSDQVASDQVTAVSYYADPDVREAMLEYCGAAPGRSPTAVFVAGLCGGQAPLPTWSTSAVVVPTRRITELWERGCDISRSLWDREHLLFLFELDYENIDQPQEPFLRPAEVYFKLEPAYRATRRVFARLGLDPGVIATGRGYHFCGTIRLDDPLIGRLAALTTDIPGWYDRPADPITTAEFDTRMSAEQARASTGLGQVIEYLAHLILDEARADSPIPVVFNGTIVGSGRVGRECVSLDFSHAGDPLHVRHVRAGWSTYQWHRLRPDIFGETAASTVPPLIALPRDRHSLSTTLRVRAGGFKAAIQAARSRLPSLPSVAKGIEAARHAYELSRLAAFHREYEAGLRTALARPPSVQMDALPACLAAAVRWPNDLLLKPEHLQHVVRGLMARGWRPADIASLVASKYEEDHQWGSRWSWMHPATRAAFDVRVFAGLIVTGRDSLVDFNCVSAQEKDICPRTYCLWDLRNDAKALSERYRS